MTFENSLRPVNLGNKNFMKIFDVIKNIVLWSYERGSWQYDVLCVVILTFIFLTPKEFLDERYSSDPAKNTMQTQRTYVSTNDITAEAKVSANLNDLLADVVSERFKRKVVVKRIEIDAVKNEGQPQTEKQDSGLIRGYRVWFE